MFKLIDKKIIEFYAQKIIWTYISLIIETFFLPSHNIWLRNKKIHVILNCAFLSGDLELNVPSSVPTDAISFTNCSGSSNTIVVPAKIQLKMVCESTYTRFLQTNFDFEVGAVKQEKYFTDRSKAALLLWIFYVFFCLVFVLSLCASVNLCLVVTF